MVTESSVAERVLDEGLQLKALVIAPSTSKPGDP